MSKTFTKLFSSITESTVWCEPDHTRLVWICMLAMADRVGRVWGSIPGLANRARVPVDAAEQAINTFLGPDKYSRTTENDGRRIEVIQGGWRLLNYLHYRGIMDDEAVRETKRRHIQKKRAQAYEAQPTADQSAIDVDINVYSRHQSIQAEAEAEAEAEEKIKEKDQKISPDGCTGSAVAIRQEAEPLVVPPNKKRKVVLVTSKDLVCFGLSEQEASDFLFHRDKKRSPLTATAWKTILSEAKKAGYTPDQAVRAMANFGWIGFDATWDKVKQNAPGAKQKPNMTFKERDEANELAKYRERLGSMADFVLGPEVAESLNTVDENGNKVSKKMTRMPTFKEMFEAEAREKLKEDDRE
jgi:hypothetical protein